MSSTPESLFASQQVPIGGRVRWGEPVPHDGPGVYAVVSTVIDDHGTLRPIPNGLSLDGVQSLLMRRPGLTVDGVRPDLEGLLRRIESFLVRDEVVQYIGMAGTSLRRRIGDYYRTTLGANKPHAGGWFIKTHAHLGLFQVYWAPTPVPRYVEHGMLAAFADDVSEDAKESLHDPHRVMPFANLEFPKGVRKRHGIRGATGPLGLDPPTATIADVASGLPERDVRPEPPPTPDRPGYRRSRLFGLAGRNRSGWTQPITDSDKTAGRIRIPKATKPMFPPERCKISVSVRGFRREVRWNPRLGPGNERSGVLTVGREALRSIAPGSRLEVTRDGQHWQLK